MPNCYHPGAQCLVGNFYVCKTTGCPNGPAAAATAAAADETTWSFDGRVRWLNDMVRRWETASCPSDMHVVLSDGRHVVRSMTEDQVMVRVRRLDTYGGGKHPSSWGQLNVPGRRLLGSDTALLYDRVKQLLESIVYDINQSPPGSGLVQMYTLMS